MNRSFSIYVLANISKYFDNETILLFAYKYGVKVRSDMYRFLSYVTLSLGNVEKNNLCAIVYLF